MSSLLSGEVPPEGNEEKPSKFGNLRPNRKAKSKRDKVRFFDSADWAMRQQNQQGGNNQEQPPQDDDVLRVSQISSIVDSETAPADNGNSSLISGSPTSPTGESNSPLSGLGEDNGSPLAG